MKKLTLPKPTLFLMVGVPGAGKSFFARQFATACNIPCVSADRIHFELFNEPDYSTNESVIVQRIVDYMTDETFNSQSSFVVDGLFANTRTARLNIERRARAKGYDTIAIWVQVDELSAKSRSVKRKPGKRDDQYNKPLPEAVFAARARKLMPLASETHIVISGKHTFAAQRDTVLNRLIVAGNAEQASKRTISVSQQPTVDKPVPKEKSALKESYMKVITPTPSRRMGKPTERPPESHRIVIT